MKFSDLGLGDEILRAVSDAGYDTPTPIQAKAIPYILMNRDVLGCAQTGTGKTASFTLPMIEILAHGRARARMPRSLILEPTRELAAQVAEQFKTYGKYHKLTMALLIGGVSFVEQNKALDRGVDVLIATPGRLMDHAERGKVLLRDVKTLVIDEADRMLDMGFIPDVEKIVSLLPAMRQTLFFSATMPDEIRRLSKKFLSNPKEVSVDPPASAAETVTQLIVHTQIRDKRRVLRKILKSEGVLSALIFCNRKRDVGILHRSLQRHGFNAGALHGDMDQYSRMQTLDEFKRGKISLLVCSDVAARGLDIPAMGHVFNFDVPTHAEDYIHRIGRTGRAGRSGRAITLATPEDQRYLDNLTKLLGKPIPKFEENASAEPKKSTETSVTAAPAPAETSVTAAPAPTETSVTAAPAPAETRERSTSNERSPRVRGRRNGRARPATAKTAAKPTERTPLSAMPEENKPFGQGDQVPAFLLREPPK